MSKKTRVLFDSIVGDSPYIEILGEQAHHLHNVLRFKCGDQVECISADTKRYATIIKKLDGNSLTLEIIKELEAIKLPKIILIAALVPDTAFDWLLQKITEVGVAECYPVFAERSVIKASQRMQTKLERWQRICDSASRQSGSLSTKIYEPMDFKKTVCEIKADYKIIADPYGLPLQKFENYQENAVALAIGPEGGFTEQEINYCIENDWQATKFYPTILRAETAAAVCSALLINNLLNI